MTKYSTVLSSMPSFFSGVARILDIGCTYDHYRNFKSPEEADAAALRSDFMAVGNDIRGAMNEIDKQYNG